MNSREKDIIPTGLRKLYQEHNDQIILGTGLSAAVLFVIGHYFHGLIPVAVALEAGALSATYVELRDPTPLPPDRDLPLTSTWNLNKRYRPRS